ncbi:DUF5403 family protein [Streptomyces sp. NPDC006134]|uniref:DUF5403 family protein n=1 Tax=Streptomyces sp. NPDC006134 TaxID=3154467 RepID=UPI0033E8C917
MAFMYESTPEIVSRHQDVRDELERVLFEVAARAEELLVQHRKDGVAHIDVEEGDYDKYVVLADNAHGNQAHDPDASYRNSAAAIEFGHRAYEVTRKDRAGNEYTARVGASNGLYILTRAAQLPKRRRRV